MAELALDSLVQLHELHIGECFDEPYGNNGSLNGIVGIGSLMALREVAIYDQQSLVSLGDLLVLAEQGVSFETAVFGFNPMLPPGRDSCVRGGRNNRRGRVSEPWR